MATALSAIPSIATGTTAISNLLLASPQTTVGYQPQPGPTNTTTQLAQQPAFLFNYEGEQTATLKSDITDHYVEDNTAIQDQWALHPITITTHGYISELNDIPANSVLALLQSVAQTFSPISAYVPGLSATAVIAYNEASYAYAIALNAINAAVNTFGSIGGVSPTNQGVVSGTDVTDGTNQNNQQLAFQQFVGYWSNRTLFTIQTPWAVFTDMAIDTLRAIQDAETNVITDFELTFKQMRFADSVTGEVTLDSANRLSNQSSGVTNLGNQPLTPATPTFASSLGSIA